MQFAVENSVLLIKKYQQEMKSIKTIADEMGVYPKKISRALKYLRVKTRTRSDAGKAAIASGRLKSPTAGTGHSEETRIKISDGKSRYWKNLSPENIEEFRQSCKQKWEELPDSKKNQIRKMTLEAARKTSKDGSAMERFIYTELLKSGYNCFIHKHITENEKLEVDLLLPEIRLVIEIDGPAHFLPIWGEEKLAGTIHSDMEKNGLLVANQYSVLRLRCAKRNVSNKNKRDALEIIKSVISDVEKNNCFKVIYTEI